MRSDLSIIVACKRVLATCHSGRLHHKFQAAIQRDLKSFDVGWDHS